MLIKFDDVEAVADSFPILGHDFCGANDAIVRHVAFEHLNVAEAVSIGSVFQPPLVVNVKFL